MQDYILIANAVVMTFLFVVWSRSNWTDTAIKLVLLVLSVGNLLMVLEMFGYIVKV